MMRKVVLGDVVKINPATKVTKGQLVKFISMDKLDPFTKTPNGYEKKKFSSGTKFTNGDILLARITPCLENGKTDFVDFLDDLEVAAGSTEFVILRNIEGLTDPAYIYYLSISPAFRDYAIKSMVGTSGRQRVQNDVLAKMELSLPPLDQQKKIANILGSLDEKIELNRRMNEALEQLGQALFRHYFVDNPEANSWDDVKVGELVDIKGGGTPSTKNSSFWGGDIVWSSPRDLANQKCHFLMRTDKTITKQGLSKISSGMLPAGTLLLSSRAPIGYIAFAGVDMAINQGYIAFLPKAKLSNYFMYFWLKNNIQKIKDSANGSTFLEISKTAFRNIYIKQPNQLLHNKFQYESMIILDKIRDNEAEIYNLTSLRDSLLPKLISGEVIL